MTGIVVQNTVTNPGGEPYARGLVHVDLIVGTSGGAGYTGTGSIIATFTTQTDDTGRWSATFTPNSLITPANTFYRVREGFAVSDIVVPASGGPYNLSQLLVTPPPTPSAPGITGEQIAAGGTVAGVRPEVNFIAGPNTTVSAADNPGANRVDVTVSSSGGAPASTVQPGTAYGTASAVGALSTYAREDHQHGTPSLTSTAPATTEGIGQAAAVGTAATPARADHVHPMAAAGAPGASAVGDTASVGAASTFAASDHKHGRESFATPGSSAVGDAVAAGASASVARADHVHGREGFGAVAGPPVFGAGKSDGVAASVSHSDHVHGLPSLPAATTAAAGIVQLDGTASDYQPIGVAAAGTVGKAADAGHTHPYQPWEFPVTAYGATGNLNCVVDAATNGTAVVTSASGKFTPAMVNMPVALKGGLTSGVTTLVTTVASYQSPTQVTLAAAATSTATGLQMVWGADDTAAFQAAQDAAVNYGNGSPFSKVVRVIVPPAAGGFGYMVNGALKNLDTAGNALYNGQITTGLHSDRLAGLTVEWFAPMDAGWPRHWNQDYPAFSGSTLFSTGLFGSQAAQATTDPHSVANGGNPAVISGPTGKFGYGVTGTNPLFNNMTIVLRNISIMNAHSSSGWSYCPFNFHGMARAHLRQCSFGTSGVVQYYTGAGGSGGNTDFSNTNSFSGGASIGGLMPAAGNNASNLIEDCVWNGGYTYGPLLTEHTVCKGVNTVLYCWGGPGVVGNYGDGGSGAGSLHAIEFGQWCVEACSYHLVVWGAGAAGIGPYIRGSLDTEGTVQIRGNTNVAANLQALSGELHLVGSPSTPTFTFPTNLRLIKETQTRGTVASPTFTLGTAQINTFYRDATVTISGGTVTAVKVSALAGGASAPTMTTLAGVTSGTFRVPAGCWWEIDGTVQPTSMQWILD